jgi:hypothetical protein
MTEAVKEGGRVDAPAAMDRNEKNGSTVESNITQPAPKSQEPAGRQWCSDLHSEPSEIFTGQPYEVINSVDLNGDIPLIKGKPGKIHRCDQLVKEYRHLVFEDDTSPLDLQKKRSDYLMAAGIVNRIVYSGGKSYHCRVSLMHPPKTKEEYVKIWEALNARYFDGKADTACKNPSR